MTNFAMHADFLPSLRSLAQKGGPGKRAADLALKTWERSQKIAATFDQVFEGISLTNHGENRIVNCRKFDLSGFSRLVTAYSKNICVFLYIGDHSSVDDWLNKNRGLDIIGRSDGKQIRLAPVYVSDTNNDEIGLIESSIDLQSNGPIIFQLEKNDRDDLLAGLSSEAVLAIESIEAITSEDEILQSILIMEPGIQMDAIFDVLLMLRASDKVKAKNRIDQFTGAATRLAEIPEKSLNDVVSSESIVMVQDVDPVLFQHFVKTANFKQWMLYLHPAQRVIVDRNFDGSARLAGVSGSGKTCVVVHRAVRLARADKSKSVLVITLNDALAKLINDLVVAQCGDLRPSNIQIKSIFQLCEELLSKFEPGKQDYYKRRTTVRNEFASSEHIDEIWREYFHCEANNRAADAMLDVIKTLAVRGVSSQDYIRQELDYLRSAFSQDKRAQYLKMDRSGRVIPLMEQFRVSIIEGLNGWERKMEAVGAVDDIGIVTALYKHVKLLSPKFHHTLVDEVQDLGTLELEIIRKLTFTGKDDLFLCGDAAQSVQTKHADFKSAGILIPTRSSISLKQNYRNSSQILSAAYDVLTKAFEKIPSGTVDMEILLPEYANFTSPNPALLKANSFKEELSLALAYVDEILPAGDEKKACIALCGFTQKSVEELSKSLSLPVLSDTSDISSGHLFLSDLEQTKGFEFDLMIILNCSSGVVPHPQLPEEEWFRDLSKLYVALTRAKTELVVSYSIQHSVFLNESLAKFNAGTWADYGLISKDINAISIPEPALEKVGDSSKWAVIGKDFLKLRDAIGMSTSAQDAILQRVTGRERTEGRSSGRRKQLEWRTFNDFMQSMQNKQNSISVVSTEVLEELNSKFSDAIKKPIQNEIVQRPQVKQPPVVASNPKEINSNSEQISGALKLFLPPKTADFSPMTHSAYMIACLLAAQDAIDVNELAVGKEMSSEVLHFLLNTPPIRFWIDHGWMRTHKKTPSIYFLTKSGVDECKSRLVTSIGKKSSRSGNGLTKQQIESFRQVILNGPNSKDVSQGHKYIERTFRFNLEHDQEQLLEQQRHQVMTQSQRNSDSKFNERAIAYWKNKWEEKKDS
jgi:superfamily I DNA/RNA helicase